MLGLKNKHSIILKHIVFGFNKTLSQRILDADSTQTYPSQILSLHQWTVQIHDIPAKTQCVVEDHSLKIKSPKGAFTTRILKFKI